MTTISSITLEVPDATAAAGFYSTAFDLGPRLSLRQSETPTCGFRGFTMSLVVSQPGDVDELVNAARRAGASIIRPAKKSLWGYGGVMQAPDGTIWKVATSSKKEKGPVTRQVDAVVLLLGVADVAASKRWYVERGLRVDKSFGKYAQFDLPAGGVKLALYGRAALAKDAGVLQEGSGSHRMVVRGDIGMFVDPDGFAWEPVT